jgi:putative oxidoreductase
MTRTADSGVILIARVLLAALLLWSGVMKLTGFAEFTASLKALYVPFTQIVAPAVVTLECACGALLVVGYRVKPVAIVLTLYALAGAFVGHNFWDVSNAALQRDILIQFWRNVGLAGGFLLLSVTGAGAISFDALRRPASILPRS